MFLTWTRGDDYWVPHNRGSSRRIQNMGFIQNDATKGIWMTLNGGSLLTTGPNPDLSQIDLEKEFKQSKISSGTFIFIGYFLSMFSLLIFKNFILSFVV